MSLTYDQLPDDAEALKHLVLGREALIDKLIEENRRLKRWHFDRSAEKMDTTQAQQVLPFNATATPPVAAPPSPLLDRIPEEESTTEAPSTQPKPKRRPVRSFPDHLPRETIMHVPEHCDCPECGAVMRPLGEDVSEMLDFVPGYFKVIRHVRPKLSCGRCSKVVQLPAPSRPIERAMPTAGLLAQVIVAKYADHCPLYRQQAIFRRAGIELERATMASWIGEAAKLLDPLVQALARYVRSAEKLHADDTPLPVLEPGRGKTRTGRIWTYVRDDRPSGGGDPPAVWYRYSPDRRSEHPQAHLKGYAGVLQADGYSGYGALYQSGQIQEAGCWAHARRKFYDQYAAHQSPIAVQAIERIGQLYAIERLICGQSPDQRQAARQTLAAPVVDELHQWLEQTRQTVSAKSGLAGAIDYSLTRWKALTRFCDDGRIDLDNNTAERSIRAIVLGRKNYLFMGADTGGERAAIIYSLIGTCLLNRIDPYGYFRYVMERIAQHPVNRVDELLPWAVASALGHAWQQAA